MFAEPLDGAPHSKQSLRLWLKLLGCTVIVEKRLRARLDEEFATTLPRFDVLAALERHPEGLRMSALSEFLMVSNGNVTGVVSRLIDDGLVTRTVDRADRRSATVRVTRKGREAFLKMAAANERWMDDMFADLSAAQIEQLMRLLGQVRLSIDAHTV
jgi:DNA-binding MarR family transcriptional regulator